MSKCSANYEVKVLPLAFDIVKTGGQLAVESVANFDQHIDKLLMSEKFKEAIRKSMRDAQRKIFFDSLNGVKLTEKQAENKKLEALLATVKKAGSAGVQTSIMNTVRGQQLQQETVAFKEALECSPMGVWVDKNKTKLIVVGALGLIGGSVYMYKHRTGDDVADLSKNLLKGTFNAGAVTFDGKVTAVVPSKRTFGAEMSASYQWQKVKTTAKINILAQENVADLSTTGTITIPLRPELSLTAGVKHQAKNLHLSSDTTAVQSNNMNAFLSLEYSKDKVRFQLKSSMSQDGKHMIGGVVQIDF